MTTLTYEEDICYFCSKPAVTTCDFCSISLCKNHAWDIVDRKEGDFTWLLCENCKDEELDNELGR